MTACVPAVLAVLAGACGSGSERLRDTLPTQRGSGSPYAQGGASRAPNTAGVDAEAGAEEADALASAETEAADADLAGCDASGSIMYLLADTGVLRTFDPALIPTGVPFQIVGPLACTLADGSPWAQPGNMAIDRAGIGWVTDAVGNLFRWDPGNATCKQTAFQAGASGFTRMGMGLVGRVDGTETLFVVDNSNGPLTSSGQGLATIDLVTLRLTLLGNFAAPLTGRWAELAGSADGHLYGFFSGAQSWIAEIDPSNAALLWNAPVPAALVGSGQAHIAVAAALLGKVLYYFVTNTAAAPSADVTAFDITTHATTQALSQIGFNVTGAAVRTCGPTPSSG